MVFAEPRAPWWKHCSDSLADHGLLHQLDLVPLAVSEAYGLHALVAIECPRQADSGVLTAGKQN